MSVSHKSAHLHHTLISLRKNKREILLTKITYKVTRNMFVDCIQGSYSNVTVIFHTFQGIASEVTTLGHYILLV